jgi:hypothetical protein
MSGARVSKVETPEKVVQNAVVGWLKIHGWMVQRNQQSETSVRGRPDLEAYKNGLTLFIECKAPAGIVSLKTGRKSKGSKLSDHQEIYIAKLREHGMTVWVPTDGDKFLEDLERLEFELWGTKSRII